MWRFYEERDLNNKSHGGTKHPMVSQPIKNCNLRWGSGVCHMIKRSTWYKILLKSCTQTFTHYWKKHHIQEHSEKLWAQVPKEMKGVSQRRRLVNNIEYYLDEYDHYNFDPVATTLSHSRKGRSKKEARLNTNRPNPAGHERKVLTKLQNTEKKRKEINTRTSAKWWVLVISR